MSEAGSDSAAVPCRSSPVQAALVGVMLAPPVVLLVAPTPGGSGAASTIGLVLAEAIALYVGYGAVTRAASPAVRGLLVSD